MGEILTAAPAAVSALTLEASITAPEGKLDRAGLLLLGPPYGFDADMKEMLALVMPRLPGGKAAVEWLRPPA